MSASDWRKMPFAPAPGAVICASSDLKSGAQSHDLDGFPVLLVQSESGLRAYVNACPHQFLPLDWRSAKVLSQDGKTLRCSNHDAGFDAETGDGIDGFGLGCALTPIPVEDRDGRIVIAGELSA